MIARRSWYVLTLATALALGIASGCTRARNDAQIAGDVQGKINADSNVPTKQITVTSSNGVVTLAGNVGSDTERQAAASDAAKVDGVKTVVNNLQVAPATAEATEPEQEQPEPQKPSPAGERAHRRGSRFSHAQSSNPAPMNPAPSAPPAAPAPPPETAMAPPPPPPPPKPVTIPDGTVLQVRMIDTIDSASNQPGDRFRATLDAPVTIDDKVVIPHGADIEGRVAELKSAGHFAGKPAIALELTALSMNGRRYSLHTNQYSRSGTSRGTNTAEKVGGGAALGTIIGAIAGGGKGAAIGGIIGAGAGGGVQAASKAPSIHVQSEALVSFTLQNPVTVTPMSSVRRNRGGSETMGDQGGNMPDYNDSQGPPTSRAGRNNPDNDSGEPLPPQQPDDDSNGPVLKRR